MKAYILTEEEINDLAENKVKPEEVAVPDKAVKTVLVTPDLRFPDLAQTYKKFDEVMLTEQEALEKYLRRNKPRPPYCMFTGKILYRQ